MATAQTKYIGQLRTINTHLRSGQEIITDAPVDNKGKGEAFSPTDLVATALCDCMLTIMGISASERGFSIDGATGMVTKVMTTSGARSIAEIHISLDFSMCNLCNTEQKIIKAIPKICPVSLSLHPDIKQLVDFKF
jgi:uncharacterized OsmC-like protein